MITLLIHAAAHWDTMAHIVNLIVVPQTPAKMVVHVTDLVVAIRALAHQDTMAPFVNLTVVPQTPAKIVGHVTDVVVASRAIAHKDTMAPVVNHEIIAHLIPAKTVADAGIAVAHSDVPAEEL